MKGIKILLMTLLILTVLLSVVLGLFWHMRSYVLVDMQFYPRDIRQLDLRDQKISIRHYEKLRRRIPECEIQWNVPFQGTAVPCDAKAVTVSRLTKQDIRVLEYFHRLEKVNAQQCTDYAVLRELQDRRPDLQVEYFVRIGSENYPSDVKQVSLDPVTPEALSLLTYLSEVREVLCCGGGRSAVAQLRDYCQENRLEFLILLGKEAVSPDTRRVTAEAVTGEQADLLEFLPELRQLHIRQPKASAERLLELKKSHPELELTWERKIYGQTVSSAAEEIDLSGVKNIKLEELEREMAYFPEVELVFLGECGLDNELLAESRDRVRDRYKLVWTVSCGSKLKTRTDATTFMPVREYVYYFNDEEAYNLRYCEDMVCIDIGHMSIHNIDFVQFMPDLEYLILAHTQLQYIEPIRHCKNLRFLELDWTPLRDLTPLKDCTALEDLNLGKVYADFTPVGEMTWLKNLWMVECSTQARYEMTQALPDTKVMVTGAATVANGWRKLDNYYKMRDLLGMHYMSW